MIIKTVHTHTPEEMAMKYQQEVIRILNSVLDDCSIDDDLHTDILTEFFGRYSDLLDGKALSIDNKNYFVSLIFKDDKSNTAHQPRYDYLYGNQVYDIVCNEVD